MPSSRSSQRDAASSASDDDGAVGRAVVAVPAHDDRLARGRRDALLRLLELDRREAPALADAVVAAQDRGRLAELVGGEGVERVHAITTSDGFEDLQPARQLLVGDRQRRQQADDVAVQAAAEQQQALLAGRGDRAGDELGRRRLGLAVAHDLEREHRAEAAHLADRVDARRHVLQRGAHARAERLGRRARMPGTASSTTLAAAQETGLPPNVPPSPPGSTASMIAAGPVTRRQRQPAAERLAATRAGRAARRSARSPTPGRCGRRRTGPRRRSTGSRGGRRARAACAGKSAGIGMKPPSPWTGSRITAATVAGSTWARKSCSSAAIAVVGGDPAVRVRRRRAVDLGRERPEALLVGLDLAGQRHRHQRAAVEAAVEGDDRRAAGRGAGDLDRVLDGLGAGVEEDRLLVGRRGRARARRAGGRRRRRARRRRP